MRNYEGVITTYTEPQMVEKPCNCPVCRGEKEGHTTGVSELLQGPEVKAMEPDDLERKQRKAYMGQ